MVSGSLAMLYFFISFHGGKQGRGQSPVEWGNFPYVSLSIHPSLWAIQPGLSPSQHGWLSLRPGWLDLRPGWLGLRPGWLGLRPGWMAQRGGRMDIRMDVWTYGRTSGRTYGQMYGRKISPFYRTSSPIGTAALPPPIKTKEKSRAGQGNR